MSLWPVADRRALASLVGLSASLIPALAWGQERATGADRIEVGGSVRVATDYLSRGVSQTDHGPALQLIGTVTDRSGIYATVWTSNVHFGDYDREFDLTLGYRRTLGPVAIDLGYTDYVYTGPGSGLRLGEVFVSASGDAGSLALTAVAYYSEDTPNADASLYSQIGARLPLNAGGPAPVILGLWLGRLSTRDGVAAPYENYFDWTVSVATDLGPVALEAALSQTDVDEPGPHRLADSRLTVSASRAF